MPHLGLVILYVHSPADSAAFYARLLGQPAVQASATFAMFDLPSGVKLGLWSRHTVSPSASAAGGGTELAFIAPDIDAMHADWAGRGVPIAQPPSDMDFGRGFVALDPDSHRLRVFRLA